MHLLLQEVNIFTYAASNYGDLRSSNNAQHCGVVEDVAHDF